MKFTDKILLQTAPPCWPRLKLYMTDFIIVCAFADILHAQCEITKKPLSKDN